MSRPSATSSVAIRGNAWRRDDPRRCVLADSLFDVAVPGIASSAATVFAPASVAARTRRCQAPSFTNDCESAAMA
jgi:hypothetical protein